MLTDPRCGSDVPKVPNGQLLAALCARSDASLSPGSVRVVTVSTCQSDMEPRLSRSVFAVILSKSVTEGDFCVDSRPDEGRPAFPLVTRSIACGPAGAGGAWLRTGSCSRSATRNRLARSTHGAAHFAGLVRRPHANP
jgi:hypothetical protein